MKESPRNKMINTNDEEIKGSQAGGAPRGNKLPTFYFPGKGVVAAESYEEALKIINNKKEE